MGLFDNASRLSRGMIVHVVDGIKHYWSTGNVRGKHKECLQCRRLMERGEEAFKGIGSRFNTSYVCLKCVEEIVPWNPEDHVGEEDRAPVKTRKYVRRASPRFKGPRSILKMTAETVGAARILQLRLDASRNGNTKGGASDGEVIASLLCLLDEAHSFIALGEHDPSQWPAGMRAWKSMLVVSAIKGSNPGLGSMKD